MTILTNFPDLPFSREEALRYLGYRGVAADENLLALLEEMRQEVKAELIPAAALQEETVERKGEELTIGKIVTASRSLGRNLKDCKKAVLFGATAGVGIDRLLIRYAKISPLKEALVQAAGAVYVEAVADMVCRFIAEKNPNSDMVARFSPGYGDFPLSYQTDFFSALPLNKIGITLNSSLIMSPSKSVTAIVGLKEKV